MIVRFTGLLGLVLAALLVYRCTPGPEPTLVEFQRFDPLSFEQAVLAKKPVLICSSTVADPALQDISRGTLKDPQVKAALDPFTRFRLDTTRPHPETDQFVVEMSIDPRLTLIFIDRKGQEVARLVGSHTAATVIAAANKATAP